MSLISWGIDGSGDKHYFCRYCEIVFGNIDKDTINHQCDTSKPRYHNRDKLDKINPDYKESKCDN